MDGLLVVDKPRGPTSHDVVARVRRALRERRIGHTGTLDPMASGVLPLVVGRATRLARFMSDDRKEYEATVRFGFATDTCDAMGVALGAPWPGEMPGAQAIEQALDQFRGTFLQQPPAYSAKKVAGQRSYVLARARSRDTAAAAVAGDPESPAARLPTPAEVTAFAIQLSSLSGELARLTVTCSSGFYVRSLAHDLGETLGVGAHLVELRRTATSGVTLDNAITLDELEQPGADPSRGLVPLDRMLPGMPSITLNEAGVDRVARGQDVGPSETVGERPIVAASPGHVRLIDRAGTLLAIAEPSSSPGLLHPAVVLM